MNYLNDIATVDGSFCGLFRNNRIRSDTRTVRDRWWVGRYVRADFVQHLDVTSAARLEAAVKAGVVHDLQAKR